MLTLRVVLRVEAKLRHSEWVCVLWVVAWCKVACQVRVLVVKTKTEDKSCGGAARLVFRSADGSLVRGALRLGRPRPLREEGGGRWGLGGRRRGSWVSTPEIHCPACPPSCLPNPGSALGGGENRFGGELSLLLRGLVLSTLSAAAAI